MSKRSKRLSLLFALTITFSALQTITKPNISSGNPHDNRDTFCCAMPPRDCEFVAKRASAAYYHALNYMTCSERSVNLDNQFRCMVNARDSYNEFLSLFNEWEQKGCNR